MKTVQQDDWGYKVSQVVAKTFRIIKGIIRIFFELIIHILETLLYCYGLLINLLTHLNIVSAIVIILFTVVCVVAAFQWYEFGVIFGKFLGLRGAITGWSTGVLGMLVGTGINVLQISPELWKRRRKYAKSYVALNIDPNYDASSPTPKDKVNNWLSYDHATLRKLRYFAYGLEFCLGLIYCGTVTKFALKSVAQAAISLVAPEKVFAVVCAAESLTQGVGEKLVDIEDEARTKTTGARPSDQARPNGF